MMDVQELEPLVGEWITEARLPPDLEITLYRLVQ